MGTRKLAVGLIAAGMLASSWGPASAQMHELIVSGDRLSGHLEDPHVVALHAEMQRSQYEAGLRGARRGRGGQRKLVKHFLGRVG